jgi:L-seryl-tRNA(Ser) seleniumtransferase
MRPDKVTLAAVAATLGLYRAGLAEVSIPVWRMIATPVEELRDRASEIARGVGTSASVVDVRSTVGGGSLPGETLPSAAVAIDAGSPDRLLSTLREGVPPVIGRIEDGRVVLDLRTVEPHRDADAIRALRAALVSGA